MEKNLFFVAFVCIIIGIIVITIVTKESVIKINEPLDIEVYFCPKDNCKEILLNTIENSNKSHCAFYDLDFELPEQVKIVRDPKIPFQLMHNKFCILDDYKIITGSMNPTERGTTKNNNNLVIINSKELAKNYEQEFQELNKGTFGEGKQTKNTKFIFKDTILENYFCPEDFCAQKIISHLNKAKESIYFMTFSFTNENIAQTLINKNVEIKGIFEKSQQSKGNKFDYLKKYINVTYDSSPYKMHHKVFIIDNKTVILGSMNPTQAGDTSNDENILIIQNKEIANKFTQEFNSLI